MQIPKKWHCIWLGSALPEKYKANILTWMRFNPDYEFYLYIDSATLPLTPRINPDTGEFDFTDPDIPKNALPRMQQFCSQHGISLLDIGTIPECVNFVAQPFYNDWVTGEDKVYAFAADVLRLCIIYVFGGIYTDIDCQCDGPIPELSNDSGMYICGIASKEELRFLDNWLIAATPKNPVFLDCIKSMWRGYDNAVICARPHEIMQNAATLRYDPKRNAQIFANAREISNENGEDAKIADHIAEESYYLPAYNNLRKICPHNMAHKSCCFGAYVAVNYMQERILEEFGIDGLKQSIFPVTGPIKHEFARSWHKMRYQTLSDLQTYPHPMNEVLKLARLGGLMCL